MKTLFISLLSKENPQIDNSLFNKLPKNLAIAYSMQYKQLAISIKKILVKNHKITFFTQTLGCSSPKISKQTQAILLVSDGKFHAVSLAYETNIPIFLYNNNRIEQISQKEIDKLKQNKKASYVKYLSSNNIGVLISTKPGQQKLKKAIELKNKLNKKIYFFISNNINLGEFENFPQIQSWINTACPRMDFAHDSRIINLNDLQENI